MRALLLWLLGTAALFGFEASLCPAPYLEEAPIKCRPFDPDLLSDEPTWIHFEINTTHDGLFFSVMSEVRYVVYDAALQPMVSIDDEHFFMNGDVRSFWLYLEPETMPYFILVDLMPIGEFTEEMQGEWLLYGIAIGIIIAVMLYNLALFFYHRRRRFIYYVLFQLSILIHLLLYSDAEGRALLESHLMHESLVMLSTFLSIQFTRHFLETRTAIPRYDFLLRIVTGLLFAEVALWIIRGELFVYDYIPLFAIMLLYVLAALNVLRRGDKSALFFLGGWIFFTFAVFIFEYITYAYSLMLFLYCAAIEALLLSFALAYQTRQLEKEKISLDLLHKKQKQLMLHQARHASMGEMIGFIAHQWRQPLTHLGYVLLNLKSAHAHAELDETLMEKKVNEAEKILQYMSGTIEDFLQFYRPETETQYFDLAEAVSDVADMIEPRLKKLDIVLERSLEPVEIDGFEVHFKQAMLNLMNNAEEAIEARQSQSGEYDGRIRVALASDADQVRISVCDDGGGINEALRETIFDQFFTTKETDGGTGLGLYMTKTIVEDLFGGSVACENGILDGRRGSCFVMTLKKS